MTPLATVRTNHRAIPRKRPITVSLVRMLLTGE
jgi:hypothetical protein